MLDIVKYAKALLQDRRGVTALEYGLIAGSIALAIVAAVSTLGTNIGATFNSIASKL